MNPQVYNLHNHTRFSDGVCTIDEICEAHLQRAGIEIHGVGIADHLFCTPQSHEAGSSEEFLRVFGAETRRYVEHVHEARRRWEGRMRVFCGCEINWPLNKKRLDDIRGMLDGLDYVLFEQCDWAGLTQLANQARRWPCPIGLAHTDVPRQFPNTSMDQVVRTMANARIFYEVNAKYLPLANNERWLTILPKHRVSISLGTDTHDDIDCIDGLAAMWEFVKRRGLSGQMLSLQPAPAGADKGLAQPA